MNYSELLAKGLKIRVQCEEIGCDLTIEKDPKSKIFKHTHKNYDGGGTNTLHVYSGYLKSLSSKYKITASAPTHKIKGLK